MALPLGVFLEHQDNLFYMILQFILGQNTAAAHKYLKDCADQY